MMAIDYVVPMVFPEDKKWQYELLVARGMACSVSDAPNNVRYRTWGTERLLVRCVRRFMPWVRDIIILLARPSQVQPWMKEEKVRVVYHKDFMPKQALPTFNSSAFEVFLHRIPGLSECFIYSNDDIFPLKELGIEEFFRDEADARGETTSHGASLRAEDRRETRGERNGAAKQRRTQQQPAVETAGWVARSEGRWLPCQHHNEVPFEKPTSFMRMAQNGLNFVAEEFGKQYTNTWMKGGHSMTPLLKSTCEHLWQRGGERIMASVTPFRQPYNFNQYIFSFWQHLSGQYVDYVPQRKYVSTRNTPEQLREVIRTYQGILCINDNEVAGDITRYAEAAREGVEERLKMKD